MFSSLDWSRESLGAGLNAGLTGLDWLEGYAAKAWIEDPTQGS
jgi:hypothetical protein